MASNVGSILRQAATKEKTYAELNRVLEVHIVSREESHKQHIGNRQPCLRYQGIADQQAKIENWVMLKESHHLQRVVCLTVSSKKDSTSK